MDKRAKLAALILTLGMPLLAVASGTNTVPYEEGFESYWRGFSLAGTNGWVVGGGGSAVVTNTTMNGTFNYFYALETNHDYCLVMSGSVTNLISTPPNTEVWLDMLMPVATQRIYVGSADGIEYFSFWPTNTGWYVRQTYTNAGVRYTNDALSTNVVVEAGDWVRVSVGQNYAVTSSAGYSSFRILVNGRALMLNDRRMTYSNATQTIQRGEWRSMLVRNAGSMGAFWITATNGTACLEDVVLGTNTPDFSAIDRGRASITGVDTNAEVMGFRPGVCRVSLDSGPTNRYVYVAYTTGGTAVPWQDYVPLSGVVGFPAWTTNVDIQVIPRRGPIGDREVVITLVSNSYTTVNSPSSTVVRIVNDVAAGTVRQKGPSSRLTGLTISEIMYHPVERADGRDGEYVELYNAQPLDEDIGGYRLSGDISYTFAAGTVLKARNYIVVAKDMLALQNIPDTVGPFTGSLNNGGGVVRLKNSSGAILLEAKYSGAYPWPASADGAGHSLTLARPDYGEGDILAWSASSEKGGSPGGADPYTAGSYDGLVINEIVTHTDPPLEDSIELFNRTSASINLSGCWLSDDPDTNKYRIANGTVIGARSFITYTPTNFGFGLSMSGGSIYLVSSNSDRVIDAVKYSAQSNGASLGRYPDGTTGFQTLVTRSLGSSNTPPLAGQIVINEIMYHPISGRDDDEYVELFNRGPGTVDLGYWKFVEGIDYTIPPGTTITSSNYLVVAKNVTNLLAKYPQLNSGNAIGNYSGQLSDKGERVVLAKPDDMGLPLQDYVIQDEVTYGDGWGSWTDGEGSSLELRDPRSDNRFGMNWAGSDDSTNAPWTLIDYTDTIDNGLGGTDPLEIWSVGTGDFIVDDILVTTGSTTNFSDNFESGGSGWTFSGSQKRSSVDGGVGYGGSTGLYVRASDRGECAGSDGRFMNHIDKTMISAPLGGQTTRIRAKVRWVRGFPYLKIGTRGHWIATPGDMTVPAVLGTPGLRNSSYTSNTGPAIEAVSQSPVLPAANSNVVISCGVYDPDGVSSVTLKYRIDPAFTTNLLSMNDNGTNGDATANDGVYSTMIPGSGKGAGTIVAFVIDAVDGAAPASTNRYPARVVPKRSAYECYVCWGLPAPKGSGGLPTYRAIIPQANASALDGDTLSREPAGSTFVYEDYRVIYGGDMKNHAGISRKGFWMNLPAGESLLGTDQILIQVETPFMKYCYVHWMSINAGEPAGIMRPALYVRNAGALSLEFDYVCASRDLCSAWFGDDDPEAFKNEEYGYDGFAMYTNKYDGGMKKSAYAAVNNKRAVSYPNDDYSQVFKIAKAASTVDDAQYIRRIQAVVDVRSWASFFGIVGLFGDSDHYGYSWVHNYYVYIPRHGRSTLMMHDTDWIFNGGPSIVWPGHTVPSRMFGTPTFKRNYWSMLKDAADGPMVAAKTDKWFDGWYAACLTNGFDPGSPATYKTFVANARNVVYTGLAGVAAPFTITTSGGSGFSTNVNPVTLSGTAPVHVETIMINGNPYYVDYTSITTWQLRVWLGAGANALVVTGYDHGSNLVGTASITVTYTGPEIVPDGKLVINEIMYNATNSYASFVELYNKSTNTLSLGGLRIGGIDCDIGYGYMIGPTNYAVVAGNIPGYQCAYGNAEVVAGEFSGTLDNGGETLQLLKPDGLGGWTVLDEVTYDDDPPWPSAADGAGPSLQLRDASRDNNRAGNWAVNMTTLYTPGRANSVATNLPVFDLVWINEVMPTNTVFPDNAGEYEPWAELYNAGTNSVAMGSGYYLSDSYTNLAKWAFPAGLSITNKTYLQVWADGETSESSNGYLHAGWRMNGASGVVALARVSGGVTTLVDYISYSGLDSNRSYGMYPEGTQSSYQVFHYPSPGTSNTPGSDLPAVFINEWMADNTATADAELKKHDWFELYNGSNAAVSLAGFQLAGSSNGTNRCIVPGGAVIPGNGFLLVWADSKHTVQMNGGALYVNFGLSKSGDTIWLFAPDGTVVDKVVFGSQLQDVGEGRWPDGMSRIYQMPIWTPGASNKLFRITNWTKSNDTATLEWSTQPGKEYYILWSTSMLSSMWSALATNQALSDTLSTNLPAGSWTNRFYKIRQVR